ncbi:trypsin-like serine peptidase [Actinomycetospora sp. C-140]
MSVDRTEQQARAAQRYRDRVDARRATQAEQQTRGVRVVDTPEQIRARAERLLGGGPTARSVGQQAPTDLLERILGDNDQRPVAFLARGAWAAETVGRISTSDSLGTGFLVGRRLVLTNNHVLPDIAVAAASFVEFDEEVGIDGMPESPVAYSLDPATFFVTDAEIDATLVAVAPGADGVRAGDRHGWNHLLAQQGKIVIGEPANVVGHPSGRRKEIAIRHNELLDQLPLFLHYEADTEPGNSGSPVFNDQWEVVALHHSGVPRTDDQGRQLTAQGTVWQPSMGDDAIDWIANEGARISVVLGRFRGLDLPPAQQTVLDELGEVPAPESAVAPARESGAPRAPAVRALESVSLVPTVPRQPRLVFLHGRSQQGRDPAVLRATWAGGLNRGLAVAGQPAVDPGGVYFPFYGDLLAGLVDGGADVRESAPDGSSVVERYAPPGAGARAVYAALIEDAAQRRGFVTGLATPADAREGLLDSVIGALSPQLGWLANVTHLDDWFIALVFRDVARYLDDEGVRDQVLAAVLASFPSSGPTTLVAHSLGTVVALDLVTRLGADVDLRLVTAGSPLGMDAVTKRLLVGGPVRPARLRRWVNAWCPADAVAIGCPLARTWGPDVVEYVTANPLDRAHDIVEYLADVRVAREVVGA